MVNTNEFELFCEGHEIDGALKVKMAKIYRMNEDLGPVISALMSMGVESVINDNLEEAKALAGAQRTISIYHPKLERRVKAGKIAFLINKTIFLGKKKQE